MTHTCNRLTNEHPTSQPPQSQVIYISASHIAVSAALVMGSIALITLLYRICSKPAIRHSGAYAAANARNRGSHPQQQQSRHSDGHLQTAFQRLSQRLSLTSMQARILQRLRDQPPKYESPTSYDARIRQQQQQQQLTGDETNAETPAAVGEMQTISLSVPDTTDACPRPGWTTYGTSPPCYDNDAYSVEKKHIHIVLAFFIKDSVFSVERSSATVHSGAQWSRFGKRHGYRSVHTYASSNGHRCRNSGQVIKHMLPIYC